MDSAQSTSPLMKNKNEKPVTSDAETSSNTKSIISDNPNGTKNINSDKFNVPEEKKQFFSNNTNNSNVGVNNSPATSSKNLMRKSTLIKKGKKKKVSFNKNYLDVVYVESFKKYNIDVSMNGQEHNDIVRCRCSIF